MTGQRATLPAMDSIGKALEPWRAKVRELGLDPDAPVAIPDSHTETPEQMAERLAVQARNRSARWMGSVPAMYADAALADLDGTQHAEAVTQWLASDSATLVLAGSVGTGKTHAAYAVANAAVHGGTWVEAWNVHDLLEAMRPGGDDRAAPDAMDCGLLVLDDLAVLKVSDWAVEQMTALLDARLRNGRRQVVTTNAPYDALVESWGDRMMDRLRYRWTPLQFVGESRRRAAW